MDYSSSNTVLWNSILQVGILAAVIIAANILQRKSKFIRRTLLPTSVLAGFMALILKISGLVRVDASFMEAVTYHTIAIGFIALGLRIPKRSDITNVKYAGLKSGALIVSTYLMQALVGLAITAGLAFTFMPNLFKAAGILLPMAYGQGPGQANNIGTTYETAYGFAGGASFGLSLATFGFLWACIGGAVYMNILIKKNKLKLCRDEDKKMDIPVSTFQDENEIPMAESVDRLTVQLALIFIVYLATYLISLGLTKGISSIPALSDTAKTLNALVWGFNFIIGSLTALVVRNAFSTLKNKKIISRQYVNNYLLNRISGMVFDLMIAASICTINISDMKELWVPFIILSTVGGFTTLYYLKWTCRQIYPGYYYEGFFSMYGMLTGTVSTGILLLREIDPNFTSPATNNLVTGSSFAILLGVPMLVLVGIAPQSTFLLFMTMALVTVYGLALVAYMFKDKWFKKKT